MTACARALEESDVSFWKCELTTAGREVVDQCCPDFIGNFIGYITADTEAAARRESAEIIVKAVDFYAGSESAPPELLEILDTIEFIVCKKEHG